MLPAAGGFTLLELVLVLFVMALAGLVVYPDMKPMLDGVRVRSSVNKTASFFDGTRTRSVLSNETLVVALAEDGKGFVVTPEGDEEKNVDAIVVEAAESGTLEEIVIEPEQIRYFPKGSSSGGEITFKRNGNTVSTIEIGSFTGLARIVSGDSR
jgi:Tfp pilus assembly protein FimT